MKRILVAMSGGVDSSVAALLAKESGHEVVGVTMCLGVDQGPSGSRPACCGPDAVADARRVADVLGIAHYVLDFSAELNRFVVDPFVEEYLAGRTPNPCVECNRHLKFATLLDRATALGFDALATGHYARLHEENGRFLLMRAGDRNKDQTYFLAAVPTAALSRVLFPLGHLTKPEVRRIAQQAQLPVAEKPESQDICFVPDGNYGMFISERTDRITPGPITDQDGRILGTHGGIPFYTVGQRGGLGIAGKRPLYVTTIDPETNAIVVGFKEDLASSGLVCRDFNLLVEGLPETATAKIRHTRHEAPCRIERHEDGSLVVVFDEPQNAVTPGQAVVLYRDDVVLGGGTIDRALKPGSLHLENAATSGSR